MIEVHELGDTKLLIWQSFRITGTGKLVLGCTLFCSEFLINPPLFFRSPDPPPAINSTQIPDSHPESLDPCPPKEVIPSYSISYSADPTPESYGVLMHCATQTDSDNILIQRYPPNNVDQVSALRRKKKTFSQDINIDFTKNKIGCFG